RVPPGVAVEAASKRSPTQSQKALRALWNQLGSFSWYMRLDSSRRAASRAGSRGRVTGGSSPPARMRTAVPVAVGSAWTDVRTPTPAVITLSAPRGGVGAGAVEAGGAGQVEVEGLAADALVDVEQHGDAGRDREGDRAADDRADAADDQERPAEVPAGALQAAGDAVSAEGAGDEGEGDDDDRRDEAAEEGRQHLDAEHAPPGAADQLRGAAQRLDDALLLEHQRRRGQREADHEPHGDDGGAEETEDGEGDGGPTAAARQAHQQAGQRADGDDRGGDQQQQAHQAQQPQELGTGVAPRLTEGDRPAEHGAAGDGGEQGGGGDGAQQHDHVEHDRAEHQVAQEAGQLAEGGVRVLEDRGVAAVQGQTLDEDADDLGDDGDGQRDAEDGAPVGAHGGDGAVQDLADAQRAQRDDAGLRGGRGPAPAVAPAARSADGSAAGRGAAPAGTGR